MEQFTLINPKTISRAYVFLENKRYCNFSIKAGEKVFQCHKIFLATYSDYFEAMFRSDMVESNNPDATVTLHGVSEEDFDMILKYIYYGEVNVDMAALPSLFITASYLEIEGVKVQCLQFMRRPAFKLKSDNQRILQFRKLASTEQDDGLLETIDRCLEDNFEKIVTFPEVIEMSLASFTDLILECKTFFRSEEWLLKGAIVWCNQQTLEQRSIYSEFILGLISFDKISTAFLKHCCKGEILLKESDMFYEVVRERTYDSNNCYAREKEYASSTRGKVTAFYSDSMLDTDINTDIGCATLEERRWRENHRMPILQRSDVSDDTIQFAYRRGKLYELSVPASGNHYDKSRLNVCCDDQWNYVKLPNDVAIGSPVMTNSRNMGLIFSAKSKQKYTQFFHYDEISGKFNLFSDSKMTCKVISMVCDANRLFVFGEENAYDTITTWSYDLRAGLWFRIPPMGKLKNAVAAAVYDNQLFVCNAFGAIRPGACDFEMYDLNAAKWRSLRQPDNQHWPAGRNFVSTLGRAKFGVFPSGAAGLHAIFNANADFWTYEKLDISKIPGCVSGKVIIALDNTN